MDTISINMRRIFIIGMVVVVLGGIGVLGYLYFFNNRPVLDVSPSPTLPSLGNVAGPAEEKEITAPVTVIVPRTAGARLVKISDGPIVPNPVAITIPASENNPTPGVAINFIERQSGHVFSYLVQNGALTRINNKTVPGIQSASWLPNGTLAFVRYLSGENFSTINTYALSSSSDSPIGYFLQQNLSYVSASATNVLTLVSGANGSVASVVEPTERARSQEVFSTPLTALRAHHAGKDQYLAFTKPSALLDGYAFIIDRNSRFSRIAGPLKGLSALASPLGKWVLISYTRANVLHLQLVNTTTMEIIPLPIGTLTDKCVWTADSSAIYCGIPTNTNNNVAYPDAWYQGVSFFSDRLWKIDVDGRFAQLVLDFSKENDVLFDIHALSVDPGSTVLSFINKRDGSLWSYSL